MNSLLPEADRPDFETGFYVDGTEVGVVRTGNSNTKTHIPHPDSTEDDASPVCSIHGVTAIHREAHDWLLKPVDYCEVWRDPCVYCFPDHYEGLSKRTIDVADRIQEKAENHG